MLATGLLLLFKQAEDYSMQMPIEIKSHGLELTDAQEAQIREQAGRLERFYERIIRVRVTLEGPGRHHRTGSHRARIDLTVPGSEIVISRQCGQNVREALREAFHAAGRCLEDRVRRTRGFVKLHPEVSPGRVTRLVPERGFGILEDAQGREIYFHRNSILHGSFDDLAPGTPVRFTEEEGLEGPQASTVVVAER
jgi:ribosomal subunit interface protein